jgi:lipoprotein-anchoring transpeptidase ErfK/SrfK
MRETLRPVVRASAVGGVVRRALSLVAAALLLPAAGGAQVTPAAGVASAGSAGAGAVPRFEAPIAVDPLRTTAAVLPGLAESVDSLAAEASATAAASRLDARRAERRFASAADSMLSAAIELAAARDLGLRVVVSLFDRVVVVRRGPDTLRVAPAAVASRDTLVYAGRVWTFDTPRGRRTVRRKEPNPLWTPPDWHYAEVARDNGLRLGTIPRGGATLADGGRLVVRDRRVGLLRPGSSVFEPLPTDEEIVFGDTLYAPPVGTVNRRIVGELGRYRLDLGDGYLLHGTPDEATVGSAVTHGCVRLREEDIGWLYANVPVGTPVYIY